MKKKKVLHIAQSAGGVAEYLYMLLKNFNSTEYENVLIVSEDYKNQIKRFEPYIKNIYVVPMTRNINPKVDINSIFRIKKIIKEERPEIVYLHSSKAGAVGRLALLFDFKTKILYNAHGWYFNAEIGKKKKNFFAFVEKVLAIKTNKIINISNAEYESALKYKIAPKKKMCIIENGIDFSKFANSDMYRTETRKEYDIDKNDIVIGVVGRLSEQKDPMTIIRVFKMVKNKYSNAKLMMVGSGELEDEVRGFAKSNNIDKDVIITGWIDNVEKYIPAFDIAVLPSKWEGFGLVIVEYMACGKPVVASNVGGIADIIEDGKNGFLCEAGNEIEFKNKIEYMIENYDVIIDKNVYGNAKKIFDIKKLENKYIDILKEVQK